MKIKSLSLKSFRGVTGDTSMSPCVYLTGPCGSGKSARLLALRYVMLGTTPTGATLEDALRYFGPLGGHVDVTLDDGVRLRRGVEKNARTLEVAGIVQVSTMPGVKVKEADEEIRRVLGVFPEMLDVRAFLGLSADKRRAFVLGLCGAASSGELDVIAAICKELPEETSAEHVAEILEDLRPHAAGLNPADSIARVIERAATLVNESKRDAEKERLAARKLAERKAELPPVVGSAGERAASIAAHREQRDAVLAQIHHQRGRAESLAAAMRERAAALAALERAEAALASASAAFNAPSPLDELRRRAEALMPGDEPSRGEVDSAVTEHRNAVEQYDIAVKAARESENRIAAARRAVDALIDERSRANSDPWLVAERLFAAALSETPLVNRSLWMPLGGHISACKTFQPRSDIDAAISEAEEALACASEARDAAIAAQSARGSACDRLAAEARRADVAFAEARAVWQRRFSDWQSARREVEQEVDRRRTVESVLARAEADEARARQRVADSDAAISAITADSAQVNIEHLEAQRSGLDALIAKAEAELETLARRNSLDEELSGCIDRANNLTLYHETAKIIDAAARRVRETMMESLVAPMVKHIAAFLGRCVGLNASAYCSLATDRDKPVLHLGWVRDRVRVAVEQMSGAEFAIYVAAIQYAMIQLRRPPLRVLCVDGSELNAEAMSMLCAAFSASVSELDHVLVASHLPPPDDLSGAWSVIECRREIPEGESVVF